MSASLESDKLPTLIVVKRSAAGSEADVSSGGDISVVPIDSEETNLHVYIHGKRAGQSIAAMVKKAETDCPEFVAEGTLFLSKFHDAFSNLPEDRNIPAETHFCTILHDTATLEASTLNLMGQDTESQLCKVAWYEERHTVHKSLEALRKYPNSCRCAIVPI